MIFRDIFVNFFFIHGRWWRFKGRRWRWWICSSYSWIFLFL